jgi:hypothetical protein
MPAAWSERTIVLNSVTLRRGEALAAYSTCGAK